MKNLMSTKWSNNLVHFSLLALRVGLGLMLLTHGVTKFMHFNTMADTFSDPLHIGHQWSLVLVIFSEIGCAALLVLGLLSRPAAFVIFVQMSIILILIHNHDPFSRQELAWHYWTGTLVILLCGPGKISVDGLIR